LVLQLLACTDCGMYWPSMGRRQIICYHGLDARAGIVQIKHAPQPHDVAHDFSISAVKEAHQVP
jgi:hypothetical protein